MCCSLAVAEERGLESARRARIASARLALLLSRSLHDEWVRCTATEVNTTHDLEALSGSADLLRCVLRCLR